MDILYNDILQRLSTKVAELKSIDYDLGQLEFPADNNVLLFPACLIDLQQAEWKSIGNGVQTGTIIINIRVIWDIYEDYNNLTPENVKNIALEKLQLLNKVHKYLHGWAGSAHYNNLTRITLQNEKREDGLKVINMNYLTNLRDAHAMPQLVEVEATFPVHSNPVRSPEEEPEE